MKSNTKDSNEKFNPNKIHLKYYTDIAFITHTVAYSENYRIIKGKIPVTY